VGYMGNARVISPHFSRDTMLCVKDYRGLTLKTYIYKWLLPKLFSNTCESRIPRSGKDGERVNCYVVSIDDNSEPYFIANKYKDGVISGLTWNVNSYSDEHTMSLPEFINGELRITHYYGLTTITYKSIYDFALHHATKLIYLKIHIRRIIERTTQYYFNKKKLITKKRMDLLQFMMEDQLDREHNAIDILLLMSKLYTIKWVLHPSRDEQKNILKLNLDSLVESGELREVNHEYIVTGKAISTIEKYEEEERRHTEAVKLQRKMVYLTVLILFIAIVQSGLIKLPTLLDFTGLAAPTKSHNKSSNPTVSYAAPFHSALYKMAG